MQISTIINSIKIVLQGVAQKVDGCFEIEKEVGNHRPKNQGWTIYEILEHISLTNHFLLILIEKGRKKALKNIHQLDLKKELKHYHFNQTQLEEVGIYKSFDWIRPEHMEPSSKADLSEVRQRISQQFGRCLEILEELKNGEGALYKTTMTVNNLGKIDVYEYIYFLVKHAERHLTQIEKNRGEFLSL